MYIDFLHRFVIDHINWLLFSFYDVLIRKKVSLRGHGLR